MHSKDEFDYLENQKNQQPFINRRQLLLNSDKLRNIERRFSLITRTCDIEPGQIQIDDTLITSRGTISLICRRHFFNGEFYIECCDYNFFDCSFTLRSYPLKDLAIADFDLFVRERSPVPDTCLVLCQPEQHLNVNSSLAQYMGTDAARVLATNIKKLLSASEEPGVSTCIDDTRTLHSHINNTNGNLYLDSGNDDAHSENAFLSLVVNMNPDPAHDFILQVNLCPDSTIGRRALELTGLSIVLANRYCSAVRIFNALYARKELYISDITNVTSEVSTGRNLKPVEIRR